VQPGLRPARAAEALAQRARAMASTGGPTLLVDAARMQVALALGLRLRYDLQHVLDGDCDPEAACVAAGDGLWVLPAARAVEAALADPRHAPRVVAALDALARPARQVVVVLPAARAAWIALVPGLAALREACIPVEGRQDAAAAILTAVRQVMSESEIDTFRLLFPGMGEAAAGRLLSGMAAIAQRHFGATLLAAGDVAPAPPAPGIPRPGQRSVESGS